MSSSPLSQDAWYVLPGIDNDVVLSTRVRLARNLASFHYPNCFKMDDAQRVQALVFDSFSQMKNPDNYQALAVQSLEPLGQRILIERGVISSEIIQQPLTGVVVRTDGKIVCTVNTTDHVRIASFLTGLDLEKGLELCRSIDLDLQKNLQFAASNEFGYLNTCFKDVGSGMKLSLLLHLPSISAASMLDRVFKDVMSQDFIITGYYGSGSEPGTSLGAYYQISNASCLNGNEEEQIQAISNMAMKIIELERKTRTEFADNKPTYVRDLVYRAIAAVKYGRFISEREGIDLLSKIKWGADMKLLSGIEDNDLFALLYRTQNAHLSYVINTSKIGFEKDVNTEELRILRLRSLIIQEAIASVQLTA